MFARYIVTPVLLVWCTFLVGKFLLTDRDHLQLSGANSHLPYWVAVAAVIGFAMWGNEPDVWRYGQPGPGGRCRPICPQERSS
jgi:hypothetical protein